MKIVTVHQLHVLQSGLLALGVGVLVLAALRATYFVTMPLAAAAVLTVLVLPFQQRLRRRLPRGMKWLALAASMTLIIATLATGIGLIWVGVETAQALGPKYGGKFATAWQEASSYAARLGIDIKSWGPLRDMAFQAAAAIVTSAWSSLGLLIIILFMTVLLLIEADEWRQKSMRAFPASRAAQIVDTARVVAHKVRSFLVIHTFISLLTGVLVGVFCWIMGVDSPFLWGLLTFLLYYIPYVGGVVASVPPVVLAYLEHGGTNAIIVLGGLMVIHQIVGNFIDPQVKGRSLSASPLVLLVFIILWYWVWGIAGAFLAVPIALTVIAICWHVDPLRPLAVMLGNSSADRPPPEAPAISAPPSQQQ